MAHVEPNLFKYQTKDHVSSLIHESKLGEPHTSNLFQSIKAKQAQRWVKGEANPLNDISTKELKDLLDSEAIDFPLSEKEVVGINNDLPITSIFTSDRYEELKKKMAEYVSQLHQTYQPKSRVHPTKEKDDYYYEADDYLAKRLLSAHLDYLQIQKRAGSLYSSASPISTFDIETQNYLIARAFPERRYSIPSNSPIIQRLNDADITRLNFMIRRSAYQMSLANSRELNRFLERQQSLEFFGTLIVSFGYTFVLAMLVAMLLSGASSSSINDDPNVNQDIQ